MADFIEQGVDHLRKASDLVRDCRAGTDPDIHPEESASLAYLHGLMLGSLRALDPDDDKAGSGFAIEIEPLPDSDLQQLLTDAIEQVEESWDCIEESAVALSPFQQQVETLKYVNTRLQNVLDALAGRAPEGAAE